MIVGDTVHVLLAVPFTTEVLSLQVFPLRCSDAFLQKLPE
jgi:hypothetical protein